MTRIKPLFPLLIIVALAYLALSFVEWTINPAHWSAIARTVLLIVFVLVTLKPLADWLKQSVAPVQTANTRQVGNAEFEQNQAVYKEALAMKNVGKLAPDVIASVRATLAKVETSSDKRTTKS